MSRQVLVVLMLWVGCLGYWSGCSSSSGPVEQQEEKAPQVGVITKEAKSSSESSQDAELDGPVEGAVIQEAGSDIASENMPEAIPEAIVDATPTALPLTLSQVQILGPGVQIDVGCAALETNEGLFVLWESFDEPFAKGRFLLSVSKDRGASFSKPTPLSFPGQALAGSPSILRIGKDTWIYYMEASSVQSSAVLKRIRWSYNQWKNPETVGPIGGVASLLSWTKFYRLKDKRVAVAFRDGQSRPMVAFSKDGLRFEPAVLVGPTTGGALATLGQFGNGWLAYSYQHPVGNSPMVSYVKLSTDGATWGAPFPVSTSSTNVHDTTLVTRLDGAIDMYYIYPASTRGFVLFRRMLRKDGSMGPEQRLTADELGEPSKPEVKRLSDGRLLLMWAEISKRSPRGYPSEQRMVVAILRGDAPSR